MNEPRLVIASNGLPVSFEPYEADTLPRILSAGGLVTGMTGALEKNSTRTPPLWVGYGNGEMSRHIDTRGEIEYAEDEMHFSMYPVPVNQRVFTRHYRYTNNVLWPALHVCTDAILESETYPDVFPWHAKEAKATHDVNARYAHAVYQKLMSEHDSPILWVQDYHLLPLARILRRTYPQTRPVKTGLFIHIPWFDLERLQQHPGGYKLTTEHPRFIPDLVGSLLAYDLVGFHTPEYVEHFRKTAERYNMPNIRIQDDPSGDGIIVRQNEQTTRVSAIPIGINVSRIREGMKANACLDEETERVVRFAKDRSIPILVSLQRNDYTKGVYESLEAVDRALESRQLQYVLVIKKSRVGCYGYDALFKKIIARAEKINRKYQQEYGYAPVHVLSDGLEFSKNLALMRYGSMLAPTLADGMNLVIPEAIEVQRVLPDNERSRIITGENGWASTYRNYREDDGVFRVTPTRSEDFAQQIRAATEDRAPRISRQLAEEVSRNSSQEWVERYLEKLYR